MKEGMTNSFEASPEKDSWLLDVLVGLALHKWFLVICPVVGIAASLVIALLIPNTYTATTKILPPQQTQSTSAVLAQLGSLAGLAGGGVASGLKNPNDLYVGMLRSRTVADNLVNRFDLQSVYEQPYRSDARRRLERESSVIAGRDGIIAIQVTDKDPKRAAALANGYVEELFSLTKVLAITEASQRRLFFEQQVEQAKANLERTQMAARQALEKGGLVQVEGQGRAMVEMTARLRAQINVKEIQIGVMRAFATAQNPELQLIQQELDVMRRELARLEGVPNNEVKMSSSISSQGIENLNLLRDMKYSEATYELLTKQLEIAKIDEAKDSAIIQVLDRAIEPDKKSGPRRLLVVVLSGTVAFLLACLIVLLRHEWRAAMQDENRSTKLQMLRDLLLRSNR